MNDSPRDQGLVHLMSSLAKSTRQITAVMLADLDLVVGHDQVLLAIAENDLLSVGELCGRVNVRPSTGTRMVQRLMERGHLENAPNIGDGRRVLIRLTPEGVEMQARVRLVQAKLEEQLREDLGADAEAVLEMVREIDRKLRERLRRVR